MEVDTFVSPADTGGIAAILSQIAVQTSTKVPNILNVFIFRKVGK